MKSINLDQSREHVPWGSHFPCKPFLVMGGGHCCIKLAYLSFFVFVFWLSISFSGLTARNMSAN